MATVAVKLYAGLKDRAGTGRVDTPGTTVGEVLRALAASARPELVEALFEPGGAVKPGFQICLNTAYLDPRKLDQTPVKDGDTLHVMPPIAGGARARAKDKASREGEAPQPVGVVLAAGASRRMGRPKALLAYGTGTFVETILERMKAAGIGRRIVVAGPRDGALAHVARRAGARLVVNRAPERGQLSSLQAALAGVPAPGYVVALVDMPAVRRETYAALVTLWQRDTGRSLKPVHGGKRGHPFVLSGRRRDAVLALSPLEQTRAIFQSAHVEDVVVDDPGVLRDVDTPDDYRALLDESGPPSEPLDLAGTGGRRDKPRGNVPDAALSRTGSKASPAPRPPRASRASQRSRASGSSHRSHLSRASRAAGASRPSRQSRASRLPRLSGASRASHPNGREAPAT